MMTLVISLLVIIIIKVMVRPADLRVVQLPRLCEQSEDGQDTADIWFATPRLLGSVLETGSTSQWKGEAVVGSSSFTSPTSPSSLHKVAKDGILLLGILPRTFDFLKFLQSDCHLALLLPLLVQQEAEHGVLNPEGASNDSTVLGDDLQPPKAMNVAALANVLHLNPDQPQHRSQNLPLLVSLRQTVHLLEDLLLLVLDHIQQQLVPCPHPRIHLLLSQVLGKCKMAAQRVWWRPCHPYPLNFVAVKNLKLSCCEDKSQLICSCCTVIIFVHIGKRISLNY